MTAHPKPVVVKDPAFLAYVRTLPCWLYGKDYHVCADTIGKGLSECSHLDGKSRDDRVLPMCGLAHRTGRWSWHSGQKSFCQHHETTKAQLVWIAEQLYRTYKEK